MRIKPFLKWAGNKYQIIERIKAVLPSANRLIEPFAGAAAVFLNTDYSHYVLADTNADLIQLYQYLQKEGQAFIDDSRVFFRKENNTPEAFYYWRTRFNSTKDSRLKSILFLYLNRHCFNGLCRYNSKGKFNAPQGRYKKPYFPEIEMQFFHQHVQRATLQCVDFLEAMQAAKAGDVVYCDPPYAPLSKTANFTQYHTRGFNWERQLQLVSVAENLVSKGVHVIISNHDTELVRQAYCNAQLISFDVQRFISADGGRRGRAKELLAIFV